MTIQDLGALGEFIAAIATLATLVYLALQLRSNTNVSRFDAHLKTRQLSAEAAKIMADPEKARIWRVGLSDPDALTEDERGSFFNIMLLVVNSLDARLEYRRATGDLKAYESRGDLLDSLAIQPGFKLWWEMAGQSYNAEMNDRVERSMSGEGTNPRPVF